MTDLQSTVETMWAAYAKAHFKLDDTAITELERAGMEAALQAALDEDRVVPKAQFQDVCDYLLAWTGFNEYCLVNVTTMNQLVPKFKHDALRTALERITHCTRMRLAEKIAREALRDG